MWTHRPIDPSPPSRVPLIELRGVTKVFKAPAGPFTALESVDLRVEVGELVAVVGASGSGKTTLLHLIAGIDRPSAGEVMVDGTALHRLSESRMAPWRGRHVGVVFQFFQLLPTLTALENVALPMDFCATVPARQRLQRAHDLLAQVGVADQADKLPATLSGGQQQRVAIARALANAPRLLVADEPTGNLDSATSAAILELFGDLVDRGTTVVIVTHEAKAAQRAHRAVQMEDGRLLGGGHV